MDSTQYCTFELEGSLIGVDVLRVQEVLRAQKMSPVPKAPPEIMGLINLRGQIVTAIDLKQRLDMGSSCAENSMNVIIRSQDGPVSLLVDSIGDVIEVDGASLEPTPDTVTPQARRYFKGVHKLEGPLLAILDVDAFCQPTS